MIVTRVVEERVGIRADQVAKFAIEFGAEGALAVDAADEVLIAADAGDESAGDGGGGFEEGDLVFVTTGRLHAGADAVHGVAPGLG